MYIVANAVVVEAGSSVTCSRVVHLSRDTGEQESGITILLLIKILAKSCEHIYNQIHQMPFGEHY